jgi:type II secretory pathway pseudopilin PulG
LSLNRFRSPLTARRSPFTAHCVPFTADRSPFSACRSPLAAQRSRISGFTYLGLLLFIAIMGVALAATGVVFHQQAQREKEKELLFVGNQFRRAIGMYYESNKRYPQELEDLMPEGRDLVKRYLRRIYLDPMTGSKEWGLVRMPPEGGGIVGVFSNSENKPLKVDNFSPPYEDFKGKESYAEWKFVYVPVTPSATTSGGKQTGSGVQQPPTPQSAMHTPGTPGPAVPANN